jgi:hypothetical protein
LAVPPDLGASVRRREGPARRAVRHVWNAALSLLGHQFAADAIARLFEAGTATADATRALFWLVGAGAAGVLFFSYYLDDTGR